MFVLVLLFAWGCAFVLPLLILERLGASQRVAMYTAVAIVVASSAPVIWATEHQEIVLARLGAAFFAPPANAGPGANQAGAIASGTVVTKADQQELIAAAKSQRETAIRAEVAATHFAGNDEVEKPLRKAIADWGALHTSALVKDAFGACNAAVVDMLSLMVEIRARTASSPLADQKRRHLSEDHSMCRAALSDPHAALIEQLAGTGIAVE